MDTSLTNRQLDTIDDNTNLYRDDIPAYGLWVAEVEVEDTTKLLLGFSKTGNEFESAAIFSGT